MQMSDWDPYQELMTQRDMIEDLIRHTNKLIRSNNLLTERVEYVTSECQVLQSLYKTQQERIALLEDMFYDS